MGLGIHKAGALVAFSLMLLAAASPPGQLQPVSCDLHDQLYRLGYSTDYAWGVRRNSSGSRVYLYEGPKGRGVLIVEGGRVVRQVERPGDVAFLNDDEQFVAWADDFEKGATFGNGGHRDLRGGPFDVDPGGRYFVIGGGYGETSEIAAVAEPARTLARAKLQAQRIFAAENKIYLLGSGQGGSLVCQTYAVTAESASLIDEQRIAGLAHEVLDMDPTTERIVISGEGIFSWQLVELHTGRYKILGLGYKPTLFLQPGVMLGSH